MYLQSIDELYSKVASATLCVADKLGYEPLVMPTGIDGAICNHLLEYAQDLKGIPHRYNSMRTAQASSKTGHIDEERMYDNFRQSVLFNKPLVALDLRASTGKLFNMLKKNAKKARKNIGDFELKYAVLFDPKKIADVRGSKEEFSDMEKTSLKWFDSWSRSPIAVVGNKNSGLRWNYNVSDNNIGSLNHIPQIKTKMTILETQQNQ